MKIFTREFCPNCDDVKSELNRLGIKYEELDVDFFKNKAKLVVRGLSELPVLAHDNEYIQFTNMEDVLSFANRYLGYPEVLKDD